MPEKVFLSTYTLRIINRENERELFERFDGDTDFFDVFVNYCQYLNENIQENLDNSDGYKKKFTIEDLEDRFIADKQKRVIFGYFRSGISGERYEIDNDQTGELELKVNPNIHTSYKKMFFLILMPRTKDLAYVVLQRRSKFGVKTRFFNSLKAYFRDEAGHKKHKITLRNRMPKEVFQYMIKNGKLKQINFIQESLPRTLGGFLQNKKEERLTNESGSVVRTLKSKSFLPDEWKRQIYNWFTRNSESKTKIDIPVSDEEFDEITYTLNVEGKQRTFFMKERHRIQPDVDVTENLKYDENDEPTYDSLINEALELINMLMKFEPKV